MSLKCRFLKPGLQQPLGNPDTGGEGVWEKIKHEDMAVCVLCDINSLLARVMGQLGSYEKMNTVFLVPGCLVHKEPLVRETLGVTRAFHLVGQFPGQRSLGARPAPAPGAAPAAGLVMPTAWTNECSRCPPPSRARQSAGSKPEAVLAFLCLGWTWFTACICQAWVAQQAWLIFTSAPTVKSRVSSQLAFGTTNKS